MAATARGAPVFDARPRTWPQMARSAVQRRWFAVRCFPSLFPILAAAGAGWFGVAVRASRFGPGRSIMLPDCARGGRANICRSPGLAPWLCNAFYTTDLITTFCDGSHNNASSSPKPGYSPNGEEPCGRAPHAQHSPPPLGIQIAKAPSGCRDIPTA